jgi:hypothetical protein
LTELQNGTDAHHVVENLNPDVPEFVPVTARIQSENGDQISAETERTENGRLHEDLEISHKGL